MSPDTRAPLIATRAPLAPARARPLRVLDVALFYGERSGGIRTYLEAKAAYASRAGLDHHLAVPGLACRSYGHRHEQRSVSLVGTNGYRLPLGGAALHATLLELRPDVVLLHDAYWAPRLTTRVAHRAGAAVVAVHHASARLQAAALPGPAAMYERALQGWYRHAYEEVDAVMSVVDTRADTSRSVSLPLRLGLDPAFAPHPHIARGDHVLYVGRLAREKGLRELLDACAGSVEPWPLTLLGAGPATGALRERVRRLGLEHRVSFAPYVHNRHELARAYAAASCVVMPGAHETFGLVALEAAASGARVVAADTAPSAAVLDDLVDIFRAGDARDLLHAIEHARRRAPDLSAASALAGRHRWDRALAAELEDLKRLVGAFRSTRVAR